MANGYAAWAARWRVPLGFAMGIAFVIFSHPTTPFLVAGSAIALLGLLARALAAGYLDKGRTLATSGPYRYTRNPLYLGSFLMGSGFAIAARSWGLGLAFLIFFFVIYWPVMRREEVELRRAFGETYDRYTRSVPIFLPRLTRPSGGDRSLLSEGEFRWERYRKNREYEAALGYIAGVVFLLAKLRFR